MGDEARDGFADVIGSAEELREHYRRPAPFVVDKLMVRLDDNFRAYIDHSPFVLIGTAAPDGSGDVSPKGGPPGFVTVLDEHHLAVPDLSGNNLLDSLTNIVAGSGIGLLFLIPGVDETLRVNGRACVTREGAVLDACAVKDRRPRAAIGVTVTEAYMHCAKAFRRSALWRPDEWPERSTLPTMACIIKDQRPSMRDVDVSVIEQFLEENYATTLWEPGG